MSRQVDLSQWQGLVSTRFGAEESIHGLIWYGDAFQGVYCTACGDHQLLDGGMELLRDAAQVHASVCQGFAPSGLDEFA